MGRRNPMRRYSEQYDALKAEVCKTLGFVRQGSIQTRRLTWREACLPLPPRPGRASRPVPLLDTQGARKNGQPAALRR